MRSWHEEWEGRGGQCEYNHRRLRVDGEVLETDVLSTQSTSDPDVVNGIRESIAWWFERT